MPCDGAAWQLVQRACKISGPVAAGSQRGVIARQLGAGRTGAGEDALHATTRLIHQRTVGPHRRAMLDRDRTIAEPVIERGGIPRQRLLLGHAQRRG